MTSFESFVANLKKDGFDVKVFDKNKIEKNLGRGFYKKWAAALKIFRHRKFIFVFEEKTSKISWSPDNYPERIVVNLARFPDEKALRKSEEDFFELEAASTELKK